MKSTSVSYSLVQYLALSRQISGSGRTRSQISSPGMRLVAVVLIAIGVAPPTLALHGHHLVDRLPRRSWFEDCCISFFPLCYDWSDARYTDVSRASHRAVWLQDAAAVPEAVLDDDQELQADNLMKATTLGAWSRLEKGDAGRAARKGPHHRRVSKRRKGGASALLWALERLPEELWAQGVVCPAKPDCACVRACSAASDSS